MATDLEFNIVGNFNTDSLKEMVSLISQAKTETKQLQTEISNSMKDMDAPARLLNGQLDRCLATADRITQRADKATKALEHGGMTEEEQKSESQSLQNMFNDFATLQSLMTGNGAFSVSLAKNMMAGLPQAVKKEFNAAAPQVVSALRTAMKTPKAAGGIDVWDSQGMVYAAMNNAGVQKALSGVHASTQQKSDFVRSLIGNATQLQRTSEYQTTRHGRVIVPREYEHVEDILPELYKGSYANGGYSVKPALQNQSRMVLKSKATEQLMNLFAENNVAVQAAERSGLLRRNTAGELEMNDNSMEQMLKFSSELWNQFTKRTGGLVNKEEDYFDSKNQTDNPGAVQHRIIRRAGSGNGGKATAAMQMLSEILLDDKNFTESTPGSGVHRILTHVQEPKRLKESYSVEKLNPFMGTSSGSTRVAISESQVTDLLGLKGHDYEDSDAIKIVSLNGYDPKNSQHLQMARDYRTNGLTIGGQHYSFHTQHGTGQNLTYRMIRDDLADAVREKYAPLATRLGLEGNDVFKAFMGAKEFKDMTALGKYLDQLNKMWTDSYELGTDISDKKFAIVDMSVQEDETKKEFANGIGYVGNGIIPHALQARGALSLKGSLVPLGADTVGEWADKTGKRDSEGRVMMRGLNGEMFDASGYHALIDVSQVKNKDAYMAIAANQGNDAANDAFTDVFRAFPTRAVADYSFDADADSLGPQMMTFLSLSPAMQKYQADALVKRLTEVQTLEGQRKYIFNNPLTDPISKAANDLEHGDEFLETSSDAAKRTNLYIESLLRRAGSGEFINYGDVADIQIERLLRNADATWAMMQDGLTDAELEKYQAAFKKVHGRDFTPEEIKKYLTLDGGVADFGHIDADKIAASRSPTGFGQIITRDNYAGILAPVIQELYGYTPTGFYGNEEDYLILADADMDADTVKAIADIKDNKAGPDGSSLSLVGEISKVEKQYNDWAKSAQDKLKVKFNEIRDVDGKIDMSNPEIREKAMDILTEMAITAPQDMGFFSNAQSRLAGNLDLFENGLHFAALTAARANSGYTYATTKQKKPGEIDKDYDMFAALGLGQEYTKLPAHLMDAFNVKKITPDKNDEGYGENAFYFEGANGEILDKSQVFETSSGRYVDKRFFDKLDKTNLPSNLSATAVGAMTVSKAAHDYGFVDNQLYDALAEVFGIKERTRDDAFGEALGFGNFGSATQRVMRNHRDILAQFAGNQRFSVSNEERDIIASQVAEAMQEITGEAHKAEKEGKLLDDEGKAISRDKWIRNRAKAAGLDQIRAALGTYSMNGLTINTGLTYDNLAYRYGQNAAEGLRNSADIMLADATRGSYGTAFERYAAYSVLGQSGVKYIEGASKTASIATIEKSIDDARKIIADSEDLAAKQEKTAEIQRSDATAPASNTDKYARFRDGRGIITEASIREVEQSAAWKRDFADEFGKPGDFIYDDFIQQAEADEALAAELKAERVRSAKQFVDSAGPQQLEDAKRMLASQAEYSDAMKSVRDLTKEFNIGAKGYENKINGRSMAQGYWGKLLGQFIPMMEVLENIEKENEFFKSNPDEKIGLDEAKADLNSSMYRNFGDKGVLYAKGFVDNLEKTIKKQTAPESKESQILENFAEQQEEASGFVNQINAILNDQRREISPEDRKQLLEARDSIYKYIEDADSLMPELRSELEKSVREDAKLRMEDLRAKLNPEYKKSAEYKSILRNRAIDAEEERMSQSLREKWISKGEYDNRMAELEELRYDETGLRRELGLVGGDSPEERANKWKADRIQAIKASLDRARKNQIAAEYDPQSTLAERNLAESEYESAEAEYKKQSDIINKSGDLYQQIWSAQSQQRIDDFKRQIEGGALTNEQKAQRAVDLARGAALDRAVDGKLSEQERAQWEKIALDDDFWNKYGENELDKQKDIERINELQKGFSHDQFMRQGDQLRRQRFGGRGIIARSLNYRDSAIRQYQQREVEAERRLAEAKEQRDSISDKNSDEYKEASSKVDQLEKASSDARSSLESLQGPMGVVAGLGNVFGNTMANIAVRLGRQVFQKALQETKRFVKEYDKSMTEIQMITQKSDTQIDTLGAGLLNTAKNLKVSFSDVATSASALYRQGLSDSEVNSRLDTIMKFSTVSGTKVDAATKLITVAMNTGLVSNADEAADIVTALGDSAATNAAQIEKGIEKAGAAAAADGTSFGELAAMLTAITSTTQVSGNIAGNTLNTIMSRMNKIGTNELIYDENGKAISGSDVSNLLKAQGIRTYDENGNKRSTFDVLRDLSENWSGMSDAEQSQIATAIAGTRMYSNFSAIMQGLQEGDIDQYLDLIGASSGIVDQKYSSYEKSLAAAQKNMQASFDKMIANSVGQIDFSGVYNGIAGIFGTLTLPDSEATRRAERINERSQVYGQYLSDKYSDVDRLEVLKNKTSRTDAEQAEYTELINNLGQAFDVDVSSFANGIADAGSAAESAASALESVAVSADEAAQKILNEAKEEKKRDVQAAALENLVDSMAELDAAAEGRKDTDYGAKHNATNPIFDGILTYDEESGAYTPVFNAETRFVDVLKNAVENDAGLGFGGWSKQLNNQLFGSNFVTDYSYDQDLKGWLPRLFQLAVLSDFDNKDGPQYFTEKVKGYYDDDWERLIKSGNLPAVFADGLIAYLAHATTPKTSASEDIQNDINARLRSDNFSTIYTDEELDAISSALANKAVSEGRAASSVYAELLSSDDQMYTIMDSYVQKNESKKTDKEKFTAMGLKDVGESGYYLGRNGERYTREELLGLYDSDVDTNAARLLSDRTDISAFSAEDQNRIQHLRRAGVQYKNLSADDQAFLRGFFPSEINSKSYTAISGTGIDNSAFEEKNAAGLAADELIGIMQTQGFEDFNSFYDYVMTPGNFAGWSNIEPVLANVMAQAKQDADGRWVGPPNLMDQIIDVLYANSYSFSARTKTAKQTGELALEAYEGLQNGELYLSNSEKDRALAAAAGNDELIAQINRRGVISDSQKAALQGIISSDLYTKVANDEKLTDEEDAYIRGKIENAGLGLTKYTDRQSAANIASVREWAASETGISNIRDEILTDYLSGFNGADEWLALTRAKERNEEYDAARLAELDKDLVEYRQSLLGNAAASASKLYSSKDLAEAQGRMLLKEGEENRLSYDTTTEQDLYEAAYSQLGEQGKEYLRRLSDTNATQEQIEEQRQLALKENARALKTAEEADTLKNAELQGGVVYARELYRQNNKTGLAANDLYTAITTENVEDWTAFANVLDGDKAQSWKDLVEAFPDLTDSFEDLGLKFKDDGTLDVEAIEAAGLNLADVIGQIAALIGEKSLDFQNRDYTTRAETLAQADKFTSDTTDQDVINAAKEVYGDSLVTKKLDSQYTWTDGDTEAWNRARNNYQYGIDSVTDLQAVEGAQTLIGQMNAGTLGSYMQNGGYDNASQWMGSFTNANRYFQQAQALEGTGYNINNLGDLEGNADAIAAVDAALKNVGSSWADAKQTAKDFNAELSTKSITALRKYGDYSEEVAANVASLSKGGKSASQTVAQMTARMATLNNTMFAAKNAKGKSGKQLNSKDVSDLAAYSGYSEGLIKEMSKEQIDKLVSDVEAQVNEEFTQSIGGSIQEALTAAAETEQITVEQLVEFDVNADGQLDLSEIQAAAEALQSEGLAELASYAGTLGTLFLNIVEGATSVTGALEFAGGSMNPGGAGKRLGGGGGGGGGGGKSALDTMLEDHKHKISEIEHLIKMNEIDETKFERMNQYDAYLGSLDKELGLQERLAAQYRENIDELQKLIGGLDKGSEDYNKAMESLWGYQEALAAISNTIDEVNAKRISITSTRQENEDKPGTHKANLWDAKAEGYQIRGQFENYAVARQGRIDEYQNQIDQNKKQIEDWEKLLPTFVENSKDWLEIRDNIWSITEENATLANEMQQAIYDLNSARIDQWNTDLTNRMAPREHEQNMLSGWADLYQNNRQYEFYRNDLGQQNNISRDQIALYEEYIAKLQAEMDTLEKGSPAWYAARDAVYQYEEAVLQATATIDENNRQIQQSKIDELTKQYTDVNDDLSHTMNMLKAQQDRFDKDNNFTMYLEAVNAQADVTRTQIANLEEQLAGYIDLASEITEDTDQWDSVQQSVRQTAEELENAKNNLAELERLSQQSEFEHLQEAFQRQDDLDQHNIKMAQYQETLYQNRGELTNYGTMLMIENELRQTRAQNLAEYIEKLEAQIEVTEEGSDTYYKLIDAVYKAEEQLESETNAIDKNTEAYKKNQEAILKTRQALVNTIDTEIKTRVKEQREMLSAEVSIQNQILGIIRKRYQQEWALVKQDINNKKKALQEEKSLINERLNARLQAEQDESKQEELSEMQRQLSLIASDPTRTKDARELQKRIDEIEKEMADQAAKDEAQAMIDQLEDESKAYDEYMAYQEEKLNEMLKDANSTALYEELSAVMGSEDMTREDRFASYMAWLEKNSEDYKYATDAARLQMEQSNLDSWNKMLGFVDTYWDEVERIINGGVDGILDYMKDSSSWRWASDVGKELLEINWKNVYEAYEDAYRDDADWSHGHSWQTEFADEVGELNYGLHDLTGIARELYELYLAEIKDDYIRPTDVDADAGNIGYNGYDGIGKKEEKLASSISGSTGSSSGGSGGGGGSSGGSSSNKKQYKVRIEGMGEVTTTASSEQEAITNVMGKNWTGTAYVNGAQKELTKGTIVNKSSGNNSSQTGKTSTTTNNALSTWNNFLEKTKNALAGLFGTKNAEGGIVDYTGLAWVDGTFSEPEAFLSAADTKNIGALMDYLSYVDVSGLISTVPGYFGNNESNSYGDINIVINQAELKSDADYDEVARQVGKAVVRQLSRDGLHINGYSL